MKALLVPFLLVLTREKIVEDDRVVKGVLDSARRVGLVEQSLSVRFILCEQHLAAFFTIEVIRSHRFMDAFEQVPSLFRVIQHDIGPRLCFPKGPGVPVPQRR